MYTKTPEIRKIQFQNDFSDTKPHLFKSGLEIKHGMQNKSKFELECQYEINPLDILMSRTTSLLFSHRT